MNTSKIFLTEEEFEELFGKEISRIARVLSEIAKDKCSLCRGKCCREIGCGLYSEKFSSCPIYEIRPRECRFHFCHEVLDEAQLSQGDKELLEKPIKDLLKDGGEWDSELFPLFPQFPLDVEGLTSLGIKEEASKIIRAFEDGELGESQARDLLKSLCLNTEQVGLIA
jgi:hypothetical protein